MSNEQHSSLFNSRSKVELSKFSSFPLASSVLQRICEDRLKNPIFEFEVSKAKLAASKFFVHMKRTKRAFQLKAYA